MFYRFGEFGFETTVKLQAPVYSSVALGKLFNVSKNSVLSSGK